MTEHLLRRWVLWYDVQHKAHDRIPLNIDIAGPSTRFCTCHVIIVYHIRRSSRHSSEAARAKILQLADPTTGTHPCVPAGFEGGCESKCYGLSPGESYRAKAREEGADFDACLTSVRAALMADGECDAPPCSFGGAWTTPRSTKLYGRVVGPMSAGGARHPILRCVSMPRNKAPFCRALLQGTSEHLLSSPGLCAL